MITHTAHLRNATYNKSDEMKETFFQSINLLEKDLCVSPHSPHVFLSLAILDLLPLDAHKTNKQAKY